MRNIWTIFKTDIRTLSRCFFACVVVLAIALLPLSRQGYVPLGRTAPPVPVTPAVSPSWRQAPPMARMQSMVASMS